MEKNKFVLPLIIILLLCFLPLSIYGLYNQYVIASEAGNPNHIHKFENKLYYYDASDKLIGYYECKSDNCNDAFSVVNDENFKYVSVINNELGVLAGQYVFVQDDNQIVLYDLKNSFVLAQLNTLKNYGFLNNKYIVQNTAGKYGLMTITNTVSYLIPLTYDYMASSDFLSSNNYAVKEQAKWFIINSNNEKISAEYSNPIYYYNDNIIITSNNSIYTIYNYEGNVLIDNVSKLEILNNEIVILTNNRIIRYDHTFNQINQYYGDDYLIEDKKLSILLYGNVNEVVNLESGENNE